MADRSELETRIHEALVQLGAPPGSLTRDTELETINIDSLDLIEVGQMVEDEYGIELEGQDVQDIKTVGEVVDMIAAKIP